MNPEIKQKWIEALRSGRYKQGKGTLRAGDKYCCLGVLYEVAKGKDAWVPVGADRDWFMTLDDTPGYLSSAFEDEVGLNHAFAESLADMNDEGKSFEEIANQIENYNI